MNAPRLIKVQQRILADIRAGKIRTVQTGTRRARSILRLIDRGIVGYKASAYLAPDTGPGGARIPAGRAYDGLFVRSS